MRRPNCSDPSPRGSLGVRGKMCVIQKGGALEKRVIRVFIWAGQGKNKVIRRPGQLKKSNVPGGAQEEGAEQFERRIS